MILPQDPVQAAIVHALNNHCYEDAIFLSERLFAEAPSDATTFLLATCYYQSGKKPLATKFLKRQNCKSAKCKYLYAKCCYDTGRLCEASFALNDGEPPKTVEQLKSEYGESASFALSLMADIHRKAGKRDMAVELYQASLSLNPFLWTSFCKLCKLGAKPDPNSVFHSNHVQDALDSVKTVMFSPQAAPCLSAPLNDSSHQVLGHMALHQTTATNTSTPVHTNTAPLISILSEEAEESSDLSPLDAETPSLLPHENVHTSFTQQANKSSMYKTPVIPSFGGLPLETPIAATYALDTPSMLATTPGSTLPAPPPPPVKNPTKMRFQDSSVPGSRLVFGPSSTSNTKSDVATATRSHIPPPVLPRRRSKRILDNQLAISLKENTKVSQSRSKNMSPRSSGTRKTRSLHTLKHSQDDLNSKNKMLSSSSVTTPKDKPSSSAVNSFSTQLSHLNGKQRQSAVAFLALLQKMGTAYSLAEMYSLKESLQHYEALPVHHYQTGWVLAQVGKAYLELSEYTKAESVFELLRSLEPYQVNGMDTYSTVLFHLQKEVALAKLAQDMVVYDKLCPQTWCVNGNCFSLQKEHETAITLLRRAVQVDDQFTYAYTLLGHEYTLVENYEKAESAFRSAIRVDSRHYNAWYGLGMIYYKKEKFSGAETHFKKALAIHPQSAVLLCHIGLVQHALQRHDIALETLNQAVELSPKNPMCLFHRASVLVANGMLTEALTELQALKVLTPKESLVFFLIGKVHKKLGNAHLSMLNFSWATDLDPKGSNNHIKEAIDRRYVTDDDDNNTEEYESSSSMHSLIVAGNFSTDTSVVMDMDEMRHLRAQDLSDDSF